MAGYIEYIYDLVIARLYIYQLHNSNIILINFDVQLVLPCTFFFPVH